MCDAHARGFTYRNPINQDGEIGQQAHYFHCDQIGIALTHPSDWKTSLSALACSSTKMEENLIQKRNNGNGAFSWKSYKDNVTVPHRK